MSKVRRPNGDDHPEAARKHLSDATFLLKEHSYDGSAYLAGYVAECALKTLLLSESPNLPEKVLKNHLDQLTPAALQLASLPGTRTAKYYPFPMRLEIRDGVSKWSVGLRYRPSGEVPENRARQWLEEVSAFYRQTVGQMFLDGVI